MHQIKSEGGCFCGEIRFAVDGKVLGAAACHCRDCQYICGGAAAYVIVVAKPSLVILKGKPLSYESFADSGAQRIRQFCRTCGTPLFAEDASFPNVITIKVGSLDDSSFFSPDAELWTGSAPLWHATRPNVPTFAKGPVSG